MEHRSHAADAPPLPDEWTVARVPGVERDGDLLLGGIPYRIVRLRGSAARAVDALFDGETVGAARVRGDVDAGRVAGRLVADDFGWARPGRVGSPATAADVTIVVPAYNAADDIGRLLDSPLVPEVAGVVVADDASTDGTAAAARDAGADVVTLPENRGPAAARNQAWPRVTTPFVLFVDADATLPDDLVPALAHFGDPAVGVVAPRIHEVGLDGRPPSLAERYESGRGGRDLGPIGGDIGPSRRLTHAASLLLLARVEALEAVDGFADDMRFGEDLDLLRRLTLAGWIVRYEPEWVGTHRARSHLVAMLRLHFRYGIPSGTADRRSRTSSGTGTTSFLTWLAAVFAVLGSPLAAAVAGVLAVALTLGVLVGRLLPMRAVRTAIRVEVKSLRAVAAALSGPWLVPSLAIVAVRRTWFGLAFVAVALLLRHATDWRRSRPKVSLPVWIALRSLDDQALAFGTWVGCVRARTLSPVLPRFRSVLARRARPDAGAIDGWTDVAVFDANNHVR